MATQQAPLLKIAEPDYQYSLFDEPPSEPIVNVASVPQRSPFRYPGGKTWFVPRLRRWLCRLPERPREFVEPFAGGGILSMTVAFERLADSVTMVELDDDVAAVWQTILSGQAEWLAERIVAFPLSVENVCEELERTPRSTAQRAFQTILRNRTQRGGILAPGSGRLKNGENGKGIASRWYPETLRQRILDIASVGDRIRFIHDDGMHAMQERIGCSDSVFLIDPPYTAAGKKAGSRLYRHCDLDHEELFLITGTLSGDFLMTYDNAEGVREMAARHGFATLVIPMKNTHHAEMTELLIGRNLDWA